MEGLIADWCEKTQNYNDKNDFFFKTVIIRHAFK